MPFARTLRERLHAAECEIRYAAAGGRATEDLQAAAAAAVRWLLRCQAATGCGGFARAFALRGGWRAPYPETTGYIIPTLLAMADRFPALALTKHAHEAGHWLAEIQFETGAICAKQFFPGNKQPSVFNTGMVLHGWTALAEREPGGIWLAAGTKAGDWIVKQQESDGAWVRNAFRSVPHVYYTMVDWALLRLWRATGETKYRDSARRNLEWVLRQQHPNGWFDHSGFSSEEAVTTHTLSYTTQGLVESAGLLGESRYFDAAAKATHSLFGLFRKSGKLPGLVAPDWSALAEWECVTGNSQTALVWKAVGRAEGNADLIQAGESLDVAVSKTQKVGARNPGVDGAIPGAWPLKGDYDPYAFSNHAAKFFIDSIAWAPRTP